jgi:hypothetical protein
MPVCICARVCMYKHKYCISVRRLQDIDYFVNVSASQQHVLYNYTKEKVGHIVPQHMHRDVCVCDGVTAEVRNTPKIRGHIVSNAHDSVFNAKI